LWLLSIDYKKRTVMRDRLFTKIVPEVANSNGRLEWASSGTVISQQATPGAIEAHPSSSTHGAATQQISINTKSPATSSQAHPHMDV
jgi:hypothetical protein